MSFRSLRVSLVPDAAAEAEDDGHPKDLPFRPNGDPVKIDTPWFEGHALILIRPQTRSSCERYYDDIFEGRLRLLEVQVQGRFKSPPTGGIFIGGEVTERMQLGLVTKGMARLLLSVIRQIAPQMHYSFGDKQDKELPHIVFPLMQAVDRIVSTPVGEIPPPLGEIVPEDDAARTARRNSKATAASFNCTDTYTFSINTKNLDLPRWRLVGLPGVKDVDLANFWNESALRLVVYHRAADGPHLRVENRYCACVQIAFLGLSRPSAAHGSSQGAKATRGAGQRAEAAAGAEDAEDAAATGAALADGSGDGGERPTDEEDDDADDDDDDGVDDDCDVDGGGDGGGGGDGDAESSCRDAAADGRVDKTHSEAVAAAHSPLKPLSVSAAHTPVTPAPPSDLPRAPVRVLPSPPALSATPDSAASSAPSITPSITPLRVCATRAPSAASPSSVGCGSPVARLADELSLSLSETTHECMPDAHGASLPCAQYGKESMASPARLAGNSPLHRGVGARLSCSARVEVWGSKGASKFFVSRVDADPQSASALRCVLRSASDLADFFFSLEEAAGGTSSRRSSQLAELFSMHKTRDGGHDMMCALQLAAAASGEAFSPRASASELERCAVEWWLGRLPVCADGTSRAAATNLFLRPSAVDKGFLNTEAMLPQLQHLSLSARHGGTGLSADSRSGGGDGGADAKAVRLCSALAYAQCETVWRELLVVLDGESMSLFSDASTKPVLRLPLSSVLAVEPLDDADVGRRSFAAFSVLTPVRAHYFLVNSTELQQTWIRAISEARDQMQVRMAATLARPSAADVAAQASGSRGAQRKSDGDDEEAVPTPLAAKLVEASHDLDTALHQSARWASKKRRILNCRRFAFRRASSKTPRQWCDTVADALMRSFKLQDLDVQHPQVLAFLDLAAELKHCRPSEFDESTRKAFFLNLYHLMVNHAYLLIGPPSSSLKSISYFNKFAYECGEDVFSMAELEHCVLRAPMSRPRSFVTKLVLPKATYPCALSVADCRLNFAISCGSASGSQRVPIYTPSQIEEQLDATAKLFLSDSVKVSFTRAGGLAVTLPKVFEWFSRDFGESMHSALLSIVPFLEHDAAVRLRAALTFPAHSTSLMEKLPTFSPSGLRMRRGRPGFGSGGRSGSLGAIGGIGSIGGSSGSSGIGGTNANPGTSGNGNAGGSGHGRSVGAGSGSPAITPSMRKTSIAVTYLPHSFACGLLSYQGDFQYDSPSPRPSRRSQ